MSSTRSSSAPLAPEITAAPRCGWPSSPRHPSRPATCPAPRPTCRAGEQWLLADDPAQAAENFRQALADGGGTFDDARVSLARALFLLDQADEAKRLISQLEADGRRDPRQCDLVAELLVEQSDLIGALDWANTGVELCLPEDAGAGQPAPGAGRSQTARGADEPGTLMPRQVPATVDRNELRMLLSLRYRIRNDMGLPEDDYDKLLDDL